MAALGGVLFLFIILVIGSGIVLSAIIGLIVCKKLDKKKDKKCKLIFKILLWILLSTGMVVTIIPLMYFFLIISNW
ncbi:MAG: hypothetical protein SOW08_08685 [Lachnospiraceae bacterium]|nr:hypothetical protein [Lachnospiraceae bacterium]